MNAKCFFSNPFQLESFPFDYQTLAFQISLDTPARLAIFDESWIVGTFFVIKDGEIVKQEDKENCVVFDSSYTNILQKTEWTKVELLYGEVDNPNLKEEDGKHKYSRLKVGIVIKRNPNHYITTILIPLIMINLCSTFIFFIPSNLAVTDCYIYEELSLLVTLLLTVFALKWTMAESMPNICHHTILDRCFFLSYAYLFNCMVLCTYWWYCRGYVDQWYECHLNQQTCQESSEACQIHCNEKDYQKSFVFYYLFVAVILQTIWFPLSLALSWSFDVEYVSIVELPSLWQKSWRWILDSVSRFCLTARLYSLYITFYSLFMLVWRCTKQIRGMVIFYYWVIINIGILSHTVVNAIISKLSSCKEFYGLKSKGQHLFKKADYCSITYYDQAFIALLYYSVIIVVLIICRRFDWDCYENKRKIYTRVNEANEKLRNIVKESQP